MSASIGRYQCCGVCSGSCYVGRDANNRPAACRACSATGRVYLGRG
ncbi:hypothetical protein AB0K05_12970 [Nonomuraea sp. NPDC049486]